MRLQTLDLNKRLLAALAVCVVIGLFANLMSVMTLRQLNREMKDDSNRIVSSITGRNAETRLVAGLRSVADHANSANKEDALSACEAQFKSLGSDSTLSEFGQEAIDGTSQFLHQKRQTIQARQRIADSSTQCSKIVDNIYLMGLDVADDVQSRASTAINQSIEQVKGKFETFSIGTVDEFRSGLKSSDTAMSVLRATLMVRTHCAELSHAFLLAADADRAADARKKIPQLLSQVKKEVAGLPKSDEVELVNKSLYQMDYYIGKLLDSQSDLMNANKSLSTLNTEALNKMDALDQSVGNNVASARRAAMLRAVSARVFDARTQDQTKDLSEKIKELQSAASDAEKPAIDSVNALIAQKDVSISAAGDVFAVFKSTRSAIDAVSANGSVAQEKAESAAKQALENSLAAVLANIDKSSQELAPQFASLSSTTRGSIDSIKACLAIRAWCNQLSILFKESLAAPDAQQADQNREKIQALIPQGSALIKAMTQSDRTKEILTALDTLPAQVAELMKAKNEELEMAGKLNQSSIELADRLGALESGILKSSEEMRQNTTESLNAESIQIDRAQSWQFALGVGALAAAILAGIALSISITRPINKAVEIVGTNCSQVEKAALSIASASEELAQGATEQASGFAETSATLEELTATTKQNAENAQNATATSRQAQVTADHGLTAMQKMSETMSDIKTASDESARIIRTIEEIAFQTNILALNAAVEAARAGEAGKSFAVVAQEVRNLAQRSKEAADQTVALVGAVQRHSDGGVVVSKQVSESFGEISKNVASTVRIISQVSSACVEQAHGIAQISTAVIEMDKITQRAAESAQESVVSSRQLASQAEQMQDAVSSLATLVRGESGEIPQHNSNLQLKARPMAEAAGE